MKRPPKARHEFVDVTTGQSVCPAPSDREDNDGAAPTGRFVADLGGVTIGVDPEDMFGDDGEHPRESRLDFDLEGGGVVDYRERAREASEQKTRPPKHPPKRPRAFRETFDSAKSAAGMFYTENDMFLSHIADSADGLRDWMDGVEVRVGRRSRKLSETPAGRRILEQRSGEAIRQAIAYVFGQAKGRRWDNVEWDQVDRLEASLAPYWEDPGGGPWAYAGTPGLYWRPIVDHRPSIEDLENLSAQDREQYTRWQASEDVAEALDDLKSTYKKTAPCLSPALHQVVERRIQEWERWRLDPDQIPEYACEPDPLTGGFTCHYPSVVGELRELRGACTDGYDPDWALDESRRGDPGFPDTSAGPQDPREVAPSPVWEGIEEAEPVFGDEPSVETLESLRQLADGGRAYGGPMSGIVERRELEGVLYQLEWRTCGKRSPTTGTPWCWCLTEFPDRGHGPYWYAYWREPQTGRRRSRYVGKELQAVSL